MSLVRSAIHDRSRRAVALASFVALAITIVGCSDEPGSPGPGEEGGAAQEREPEAGQPVGEDVDDSVVLLGTDDLQWDTTELEATPGVIAFELQCEPRVNHNVVIIERGVEVAACGPGETSTGTIELDAGAYTYVCTIPGHSGTMRGSLTVADRVGD